MNYRKLGRTGLKVSDSRHVLTESPSRLTI
jgi:hypothetical protein